MQLNTPDSKIEDSIAALIYMLLKLLFKKIVIITDM